jgi:hypothetical protein
MGNVAGVTADEDANLAEQLSLKTGVDDELIQSAENVLLTFGRVRDEVGRGNDIFTRATTVALDMSVALGQDMQASVTQLGKALNDPIAGISALSRVGVQFTDEQKEAIEVLVAYGDTLGAQKIILAEVEAQFTGSAEAQATASDKLAVAFGNLQEKLGEKLLPLFESFSTWIIEEGIPAAEDFSAWIDENVAPAISRAATVLGEQLMPWFRATAAFVMDRLVPSLQRLFREFGALVNAITNAKDETSEFDGAIKGLGFLLLVSFAPLAGITLAFYALAEGARWASIAIRAIIDQARIAIGWLNSLKNTISNMPGFGFLGGFAGVAFDIFGASGGVVTSDGIERFASGGVVGRGRDTVPAMLSPGEMVLTMQDQQNLMAMLADGPRGGRGGDTYVTNVNVTGSVLTERGLVAALNRAGSKGIKLNPGVIG